MHIYIVNTRTNISSFIFFLLVYCSLRCQLMQLVVIWSLCMFPHWKRSCGCGHTSPHQPYTNYGPPMMFCSISLIITGSIVSICVLKCTSLHTEWRLANYPSQIGTRCKCLRQVSTFFFVIIICHYHYIFGVLIVTNWQSNEWWMALLVCMQCALHWWHHTQIWTIRLNRAKLFVWYRIVQ